MNNVYGYSYEQFLEWIEKKKDWSMGKNLPEGFVPDTTYVLVDEDVYVGVFNLRHCLNEFLREGPGHIGYCIWGNYRDFFLFGLLFLIHYNNFGYIY